MPCGNSCGVFEFSDPVIDSTLPIGSVASFVSKYSYVAVFDNISKSAKKLYICVWRRKKKPAIKIGVEEKKKEKRRKKEKLHRCNGSDKTFDSVSESESESCFWCRSRNLIAIARQPCFFLFTSNSKMMSHFIPHFSVNAPLLFVPPPAVLVLFLPGCLHDHWHFHPQL